MKLKALALLALLALVACGRAEEAPKQTLKDAPYQASTALPDRVENLSGTAFFNVSEELATRLGAAGEKAPGGIDSFFVLLNSKNPTEGVLVRAGSSIPKGLIQQQDSRKLAVTGDVKRLEDPSVLTHVQERFEVSLARDAQGFPLWIDNEARLDLSDSAAATPAAAPASPAPEATP